MKAGDYVFVLRDMRSLDIDSDFSLGKIEEVGENYLVRMVTDSLLNGREKYFVLQIDPKHLVSLNTNSANFREFLTLKVEGTQADRILRQYDLLSK